IRVLLLLLHRIFKTHLKKTFAALTWLYCNWNQLSSLDVSANTDLDDFSCCGNQLSSIDVSANTALTYLHCDNNQLTSLDLSENTSLGSLDCSYNQLTSLNVAANTALASLSCYSNQFVSLDVRNGNNANFYNFNAESNPNLICIYVDDKTASYLSDWTKDEIASFVNNEDECLALSVSDFTNQAIAIYPNPTNGLLNFDFSEENIQMIKITDIIGKIVFERNNLNQTEVIDISHFTNGLYIINLQADKGSRSLKVMKE
ncbi:MAG: T9SS type A sorting domain-containing protein, partial [Bacteroidales bacterium]|nr:T9SS type A sorting domain-containing protein [Bacteroidales bacterium]